jgi:hypothetical protein
MHSLKFLWLFGLAAAFNVGAQRDPFTKGYTIRLKIDGVPVMGSHELAARLRTATDQDAVLDPAPPTLIRHSSAQLQVFVTDRPGRCST